ncbi:hypothetical protein TNCV_930631 [Trichonephila clavipes]|uniref:Uncharacterized protein n=1 Tax=Trichonephila clavipes TaxID=2585209 RepID=A0A8X6W2M6_TRICX|nr:hypothetical protein TNCV_930631 [Trichonephila clavipes]
MKSGDLLVETNSAVQSKSYLSAKTFLDSPLLITLHKSLTCSRGVISEPDLLYSSGAEILEGFSDQGTTLTIRIFCHGYIAIKSQPPNSLIDAVSTASDHVSISAASSSSTACSVIEMTTTTSNIIPVTSQDTNQTSKPRRKKRPPKNQSNTIKLQIEIKMVPHRPRKSAPTEYTTDEEDMIIYDVQNLLLRHKTIHSLTHSPEVPGERDYDVAQFCLTAEHDYLGAYLNCLGLATDEAFPLCGHAGLDSLPFVPMHWRLVRILFMVVEIMRLPFSSGTKYFLTGLSLAIASASVMVKLWKVEGIFMPTWQGNQRDVIISEDANVGQYHLQSADPLGWKHSAYKGNDIMGQFRVIQSRSSRAHI